jgi:hypothetical protein
MWACVCRDLLQTTTQHGQGPGRARVDPSAGGGGIIFGAKKRVFGRAVCRASNNMSTGKRTAAGPSKKVVAAATDEEAVAVTAEEEMAVDEEEQAVEEEGEEQVAVEGGEDDEEEDAEAAEPTKKRPRAARATSGCADHGVKKLPCAECEKQFDEEREHNLAAISSPAWSALKQTLAAQVWARLFISRPKN